LRHSVAAFLLVFLLLPFLHYHPFLVSVFSDIPENNIFILKILYTYAIFFAKKGEQKRYFINHFAKKNITKFNNNRRSIFLFLFLI